MAIKKYDELTFSDDFMFCKVLQSNPDLCRELTNEALRWRKGIEETWEREFSANYSIT